MPLHNLSETDKEFIRNNHTETTVLDMAKKLNRATQWVYTFMDEENLEVFRKRPGRKRIPPSEGMFVHIGDGISQRKQYV